MSFWSAYPEIEAELELVEVYIKKTIPSRKQILTDIAMDLIEAGGKRLRPAFLILAAKQGKRYDSEKIIPLAGAMELLHTATLVHDDIIDEAKFRRGKSSVYSKWGQDMAIYTGDYLFARVFMMLSQKTSFDRLYYTAKAIKAICEGEIDQYEIRYRNEITIYDYLKRIYRKTAILFAMSMTIGAHESHAKKELIRAMGDYGLAYGMAFQIKDDLLDYTSTEKKIGKPIGNDIRQGVYTMPLLYALNNKEVASILKGLLSKKEQMSEEEIQTVIRLVKQTDSITQTQELMNKFILRGQNAIERMPNTGYKIILRDLLSHI